MNEYQTDNDFNNKTPHRSITISKMHHYWSQQLFTMDMDFTKYFNQLHICADGPRLTDKL